MVVLGGLFTFVAEDCRGDLGPCVGGKKSGLGRPVTTQQEGFTAVLGAAVEGWRSMDDDDDDDDEYTMNGREHNNPYLDVDDRNGGIVVRTLWLLLKPKMVAFSTPRVWGKAPCKQPALFGCTNCSHRMLGTDAESFNLDG